MTQNVIDGQFETVHHTNQLWLTPSTTSSLKVYLRIEVVQLVNILNQTNTVLIDGSPGVGKSLTTALFALRKIFDP